LISCQLLISFPWQVIFWACIVISAAPQARHTRQLSARQLGRTSSCTSATAWGENRTLFFDVYIYIDAQQRGGNRQTEKRFCKLGQLSCLF
jgi:hypothetical protein